MPIALPAQPLSVAASPRFAGYNPKRLAKTTLVNFATSDVNVGYTYDSVTRALDTTYWLCNNGTNFSSIKHTHIAPNSVSITKRALGSETNLTGKQIGVRFYVHPGSGDTSSDSIYYLWIGLKSSGGTSVYMLWNKYLSATETPSGWQTVYINTNVNDNATLYGDSGTLDLSAVTDIWVYLETNGVANKAPSVTWDEVFSVTPPSQGYVAFCFESGYTYAMRAAGYLESLGLRGSFALEPNRVTQAHADFPSSSYLTLAQAKALKAAGHFIYMYPRTLRYYPGGNPGGGADYDNIWGNTAEADKPRKIHFCREALTNLGLLDDCGQYVMAIPGSSWTTDDNDNFLGKEVLYLPTNNGPRGLAPGYTSRLHSLDWVYGHVGFAQALDDASDSAIITLAAADKALYIPMWHCANIADTARCITDIGLCVSAGLKFITFRDLMTGNL